MLDSSTEELIVSTDHRDATEVILINTQTILKTHDDEVESKYLGIKALTLKVSLRLAGGLDIIIVHENGKKIHMTYCGSFLVRWVNL